MSENSKQSKHLGPYVEKCPLLFEGVLSHFDQWFHCINVPLAQVLYSFCCFRRVFLGPMPSCSV